MQLRNLHGLQYAVLVPNLRHYFDPLLTEKQDLDPQAVLTISIYCTTETGNNLQSGQKCFKPVNMVTRVSSTCFQYEQI